MGKAPWDLPGASSAEPVAAWRHVLAQSSPPVAQLEAALDDISARRDQARALTAQLEAFDEQLVALEAALRPLLEWSRTGDRLRPALLDPLSPQADRDVSAEAT